MKIKRALISVSDKNGVVEFARTLHKAGVEIVSTGGTMKALREAGIPVIYVSDVTGFPKVSKRGHAHARPIRLRECSRHLPHFSSCCARYTLIALS